MLDEGSVGWPALCMGLHSFATVQPGGRSGSFQMILHKLAAWRPRRLLGAAVLALGLMFTSAVSWAMRVSPMVAEMTTTGAGSAARIEVGNVGATALPFETM